MLRSKRMVVRPNMHSVTRIMAAVIAATIISAGVAHAARSHPLNEDAALALLERTLKQDDVYSKRISLGCVSYDTEEKSGAYFQFALREVHNARCGGDPDISPVVARYRVYRRSEKIQRWQATDDTWQSYNPVKIK
jgi:hypothetical protein